MDPVIAPEDLLALLGRGEEVTLLDVRWQLGRDDGPAEYRAGHLPGAVFVDLGHDLADPPGAGRHPLPDPVRFGAAMRRCGVRAGRPVVVYDAAGGTAAARAWWLLRHHGHPAVRVLDGGYPAWVAVGGAVETGSAEPDPGDFVPRPGTLPVVDADQAARLARDGVLVDARSPERYAGESEPVDPVAGHVPGALSVPTTANLVESGGRAGRFRSVAELTEVYAEALRVAGSGGPVGAYCGSGVTATHDLLALERLGVTAALYAGSWSEWVSDPSRPVQTGRTA